MPKTLTKTKVILISSVQHDTLVKMKSYGVDVGRFIREAIAEKIKRDQNELIPNPEKTYCPFSGGTIEIDENGKEIQL